MPKQKLIAFIVCTSVIVIIALILACIAFSNRNQNNVISPNQIAFISKLQENMNIDNNNCVQAQCFTDQFVQTIQFHVQDILAHTNIFENINCKVFVLDNNLTFTTNQIESKTNLIIKANNVNFETTPIILANLTTQERLNLTDVSNGTLVYDVDIDSLFAFQGNQWQTAVANGVTSVSGSFNIDVGSDLQNPILNLTMTGVVANTYDWASVVVDVYGRLSSVVSNAQPVASVSGTTSQIVSTGGVNPVISLDPTLYASIQNWQDLEPSGIPLDNQFLVYSSSLNRLNWLNVGNQPFNSSRNIYVDKSGNDTTGNGTNLFPFLTVSKAVSIALAGNTSVLIQTCILIGCGNYTELNPIAITKSGLNIFGETQRGCILTPSNPALPLFTLNNVNCLFAQTRFEVGAGLSSSSCFNVTGTFNVGLTDCIIRYFQTGILFNGNGPLTSTGIINDCIFFQNTTSVNVSGINLLSNSNSITGSSIGQAPSISFNGIVADNSNTIVYIASNFFVRCGFGVKAINSAYVSISGGTNFAYNLIGIDAYTQSTVGVTSCDFSKMDINQIAIQLSDSGTTLRVSGCNIDGLSVNNVVSGIGVKLTNESNLHMQGCNISSCVTGILIGLITDTSSTMASISATSFYSNITSLHLQGTSSFTGTFITIDDSATLVFDSTDNVQLALATVESGNPTFKIGTLTNMHTHVLGIATKLVDSPGLHYSPNIYNFETLQFKNPDATVNSSLGNVSLLNSSMDVITRNIANLSQIKLYSDISSTFGDGNDIRGWNINKTATTGELEFLYQNNIIGQPTIVDKQVLQLDAINDVVNIFNSAIKWTNNSMLYEMSSDVLKTNGNMIIGGLDPNFVVVTDSNSQLSSASTTSTELNYLTGATSNIQTQLNNKLNLSGGILTGQLSSTFVGTASNPTFHVNNTGIYSSNVGHFNIETNNTDRILIDDNGLITFYNFTTTGVVHNNASGLLSTSLIVNNDITNAAISNSKLQTVSSTNNNNYIVSRDSSGNFTTNMIRILGTTSNATDVATKSYVDAIVSTGFTIHDPANVLSIVNVVLSGLQTIDSILLTDNDRVLLIAQTDNLENGPWLAHSGAWTRPVDFLNGQLAASSYFLILSGTVYMGTSYVCTTPTAIIGTDPISFAQFSLPTNPTGENDGTGEGQVYSSSIGDVLHFRTLKQENYIEIVNNTNEINIGVNADFNNTFDTVVARDSLGNFSATTITADLIGSASLNLLLVGGELTGPLILQDGSFSSPSLLIGTTTNTGLSNSSLGDLQFTTNSLLRMVIEQSGNVIISNLSTNGIVHNDNQGLLTTSLIVNNDITNTTISNSKLATVSSANNANYIVSRDASGNFSANVITSNLMGDVTGNVTGNVTGHASLDLALTGGTLSGNLVLPAGSASTPSLQVGNSNVGLSENVGSFQISTNATLHLSLSSAGTLRVHNLSTGLVHSGATGIFTSSLLVDSDITIGTIANNKLQTLTTALLVSNSATTATSANTASAIVARDASGNFIASNITATITGHSSLDLPLTGGTLSGNLLVPSGLSTLPSLQIGSVACGLSENTGVFQISTNSLLALSINTSGTLRVVNLSTGIAHVDASGNFTSSLIVDADITTGTIANNKLQTLTTALLVSNSATTATSANTASAIVSRDGSGNFTASNITASITGHSSLDLALTGGTLSGNLLVPSGLASQPSLQIGTAGCGMSSNSGIFQISTNFTFKLSVDLSGTLRVANLSTGVAHTNENGDFTSSLIVDADITTGTIANNKLQTLTTALLVSNSATTATSANTANAIVARDGSGNFSCGAITATSVDSSTSLTLGGTNATSVTIGKSAILSLVNGIFAVASSPSGSWYCLSNFSPTFNAGVARLIPPTVTFGGTLTEFTQTLGVMSYTGTRTRTFQISYNITFTSGPNGSNMTFFNSITGSLVIASTQTSIFQQIGSNNTNLQMTVSFSDNISLATGNTVQLAAMCAINTSAVTFTRVSMNISSILN